MSYEQAQYTINFREDAPIDHDARVVKAHRVEGWSNDYAFFGHEKNLDIPTVLIPRDLVYEVRMDYDHKGDSVSN